MQKLKNFNWKNFFLQGILPFALAITAAFIARYQLELSDGVTPDFLAMQWPLYAPLNALTAFCLTLVLFAILGKWSRATGISGALFTVIALINYYTRDLHGSALMPQDILNLGTAAEVMGSYTLQITATVRTIILWYLPVLAIAFVQGQLVKDCPKRASWRARGVRVLGCTAGVFCVLFFGYFGPVSVKPKTTYGWAWQNTYYKYGYLAGTIEAASLMADPIIEPENYSDDAAVTAAAMAEDFPSATAESASTDYPDIILVLSESFYDFDLVTDLQADTEVMPVTKNLPNAVYGHTISPHVGGGTNSSEYEMLSSNSLMLMPSITPFNWLNLHNANSLVSYLKDLGYSTLAAQLPPRLCLAGTGLRRDPLPRRLPHQGVLRQPPVSDRLGLLPRLRKAVRSHARGQAAVRLPGIYPEPRRLHNERCFAGYCTRRHRLRRVRRADGRIPELYPHERRRRAGTVRLLYQTVRGDRPQGSAGVCRRPRPQFCGPRG